MEQADLADLTILFLLLSGVVVVLASVVGGWMRRRNHHFVLLREARVGDDTLVVWGPDGETSIKTMPLMQPIRAGQALRIDWQRGGTPSVGGA